MNSLKDEKQSHFIVLKEVWWTSLSLMTILQFWSISFLGCVRVRIKGRYRQGKVWKRKMNEQLQRLGDSLSMNVVLLVITILSPVSILVLYNCPQFVSLDKGILMLIISFDSRSSSDLVEFIQVAWITFALVNWYFLFWLERVVFTYKSRWWVEFPSGCETTFVRI